MPTNLLRARHKIGSGSGRGREATASGRRVVVITVGRVEVRAELLATVTADRIWAVLPLFSTAETWGEAVHFETPVKTGRERAARLNAVPGTLYYWSEDDRVIIPFGPTPISRTAEIRLPSPCNVWARALSDVKALLVVHPGEKVSLTAAPD